eukprot:783927-Pleurochrysis_carterae.AAC.1
MADPVSDAKKCLSGTLRGRITSNIDAAECKERGWEVFLAYVPGVRDFASPVYEVPLASGQHIQCQPPLVSSVSKVDVPAAVLAGTEPGLVGVLLGILSGEEQWKCKDEKVKTENRRFALVAFEKFEACFVQLDQISLQSEAERSTWPDAEDLDARIAACLKAAANGRKPGALNQAFISAALKLKRLEVLPEAEPKPVPEPPRRSKRDEKDGRKGVEEEEGEEGEESEKGEKRKGCGVPRGLHLWGEYRLD